MREKMIDVIKQRDAYREELCSLRGESHQLKDRLNEISKLYETQLESENKFLKGIVLHLTSKPVIKKDDGKGFDIIEGWKEAGIENCDFVHRFR